MMIIMKSKFNFICRKKEYEDNYSESSDEPRQLKVLGLLDITAIGVSCSLNGIYVMLGESIKYQSGPSITISFIIAGLITLLSGFCYCELISKLPNSSSTYTFIYVTIGEFLAFCIGWNQILHYMIGVSSDSRALSQNIDSLLKYKIHNLTRDVFSFKLSFIDHPDFLAFVIVIIVTVMLIITVKESSIVNILANSANILIIFFMIGFGSTLANSNYWKLTFNKTNTSFQNSSYSNYSSIYGTGGFMPFGFNGILKSMANCVYAYTGFDAIISTSKEAKNPKRDIPIAIALAIMITTICFVGLSTILTLMIPYFLIDENSTFSSALVFNKTYWAQYLISAGIMLSIAVSIYSEMFVIPRVLNDMASDGLIFRFLSKILERFRTPGRATFVSGIMSALFALIFDLNELIEMMAIGALFNYSIVAICIVILRYRPDELNDNFENDQSLSNYINKIKNLMLFKSPTLANKLTSRFVNVLTGVAVINMICLCLMIRFSNNLLEWYNILLLVIFGSILLIESLLIWKQPQIVLTDEITADEMNSQKTTNKTPYKIPLVPFTPFISFMINFYIMLTLPVRIWIGLTIWTSLGLIIYFSYGIRNSSIGKRNRCIKSQTSVEENLLK